MNFTFYTIALPFVGDDLWVQHNSIQSWLRTGPGVEVLLLGDEPGVAEHAKKFGVRHIPDLDTTEIGDLSVRSAFWLAREHAQGDVLIFMDADVIALPGLLDTLYGVALGGPFLAVGFRKALTLTGSLDFSPGWDQRLRATFKAHGKRYHKGLVSGTDFYAYLKRQELAEEMPDFSVGAGHWDGWPMWYALRMGWRLIDITDSVDMIHQNHKHRGWRRGQATQRNLDLCDGGDKWAWVHNANVIWERGTLCKTV